MSGFKSQLHHPPKWSWASSRDQAVCLSFRLWSSTVFTPPGAPTSSYTLGKPGCPPPAAEGQPGTGLAFTSLALQAPPFPSQTSHPPALLENRITFSAPLERPPLPHPALSPGAGLASLRRQLPLTLICHPPTFPPQHSSCHLCTGRPLSWVPPTSTHTRFISRLRINPSLATTARPSYGSMLLFPFATQLHQKAVHTCCFHFLSPHPLLDGPGQASSSASAKPPVWWSAVTTMLLHSAAGSQPRGVCPSAAAGTADCPLLLDVLL